MAKAITIPAVTDSQVNGAEEKKKRTNPWMHKLSAQMIADPFPLDFIDGMDSKEYALEKLRREVIAPLGFASQKDWLEFARQGWSWAENSSIREKQAEVNSLISRIEDDPELIQLLRDKLEALV